MVDSAGGDFEAEFRSLEDEAWYNVRLVLRGSRLTDKFLNFSEEENIVFEASDGSWSSEKLEDLKGRLRPLSVQMQDNECSRVVKGMLVCAAHSFDGNDLRFYDAVVEEVMHVEHSLVMREGKREGECKCTFLLFWQHGPGVGTLTAKNIESICIVGTNEQMLSEVASFVEMVKEKLRTAPKKSNSSPLVILECEDSGFAEKVCQDTDIGGVRNQHILLVDNLEKDLSPWTVMRFIHEQTSIWSKVFVFPSLSSESYTRGVIVLDNEKDLEELSSFLNYPNQIVTSSKGRPWIITET